jgi:tetratricopeptide (TPR) repeat protein
VGFYTKVARVPIKWSIHLTLVIAAVFPALSHGYSFVPTEQEWAAWPDYCRGRYVTTIIGQRSHFVSRVTPEERLIARRAQDSGAHGLHHYCAALVYLSDARTEPNSQRKMKLLERAEGELMFGYPRTPKSSFLYTTISITYAQILYEKGEFQQATQLLNNIIEDIPSDPTLYSALAQIHWKQGNFKAARDALLAGNELTGGRAAEIHYNLGLILIEMNLLDEAVQSARTAYELGYPLPGLRNRLARLGRSLDG